MARIAPGTRMGPYEVVSFLAAGGMGEVYRGHDARLGRPVAIKVLHESSFRDEESIRRFEREARAAAAVSHPNLISIHDVGQSGDVHYLVMDLLEGQTLREHLGAGALSWQEAVKLAIDVAEGIGAVHAKGFVHRDLKPENIFLTLDGWVKLLDFGLAVNRAPAFNAADATVERITERGVVAGTLAYMSPEQLRDEEIDGRSDIFSLGCVLYEMLTGTARYGESTFADTIAAVLSSREVILPPMIPAGLTRIVRRCLAIDRAQRFQTAADLSLALRGAGDDRVPSEPEPLKSIAVLPFANVGADKENDYFSEGLSEEILNALTRVPGLKVTARTSAFAFRGKHEDIRRIGEALAVKTILEGGVRRDGNRVRVTAQLIDAASGYHLWSARYDRDMTDVFAVQDEIASAIVETLQLRLAPGARKDHTPGVSAYHAYLKSRYHFGKLTPERLLLSQTHAEEAIALDPHYPPALAQLAEGFIQTAVYGMRDGVEMLPKAREAALKAVAIDETEAGAQMTLARVAGELDFDWTEALRRCRLALASDRISPAVRALCAQYVLWPLGRPDELAAAIGPALSADPLSPMPRFVMAQALVSRGDYEQALAAIGDVLEMHETFWPGHLSRGAIYSAIDRSEEAIVALEKGLAISPWNTPFMGLLAGHYQRTGQSARAEEVLARTSAVPSKVLGALGRASFHFIGRDYERTADEYDTVIDARYPVAAYYLTWMCLKEPFRESAPGMRLRRKMNLIRSSSPGPGAAHRRSTP